MQTWHVLVGYFFLLSSLFHGFLKHMFPHITWKCPRWVSMRPTWGLSDGSCRAESVPDSHCITSILSEAQSFSTCSRTPCLQHGELVNVLLTDRKIAWLWRRTKGLSSEWDVITSKVMIPDTWVNIWENSCAVNWPLWLERTVYDVYKRQEFSWSVRNAYADMRILVSGLQCINHVSV
jgi:hypothetical protein